MEIVFLDTETTGLRDGRLIQLAYKMRGSEDIFVEYFKPPVAIEFEAMGTHHITEKMVADKLPFSESPIYMTLPSMLKNSILLAHNATFDIGILKTEGVETGKYVCTYKVAKRLYDFPNHKLQSLRYRFGVELDEASAHDAAGDVLVLEAVFNHILKDYMEKNNLTEEEAIEKFIEMTCVPVLLEKINFGKYSGKSFHEIKTSDPRYFEWLSTLKDKDDDFIHTIQHHLKATEAAVEEAVPF